MQVQLTFNVEKINVYITIHKNSSIYVTTGNNKEIENFNTKFVGDESTCGIGDDVVLSLLKNRIF